MARFLADTSIWSWANRPERPDIRAKLAERFERGEIVTCAPVILEAMHRPRSGKEYEALYGQLFAPIACLPLTAEVGERAIQIQREMAQPKHGNHLRPAVDYLIAATAELADTEVVLWAFDKGMRIIAEHTGQPCEAETSTGPGH